MIIINTIKQLFKPLRRKLTVELAIKFTITAMSVAFILDIVIVVISKYIYVKHMWLYIVYSSLFFVICGLVYAFIKRPSMFDVAKVGDSLGFKERFSTSMELALENDNSPAARLVIEDSIEKAKTNNLSGLYKLKLPGKHIKIMGILLLALIIFGYIPPIKAEEISKQILIQEKAKIEMENIEKYVKKIKEQTTENKAKEAEDIVEQLKKELNNTKNSTQAVKSVQKAQMEINKIKSDTVSKDLKALGESFSKYKQTRGLGESLIKGDTDKIKSDLEKLTNNLKNGSDAEKEQIKKAFMEAAKIVVDNKALQDAVNKYSNEIEQGNFEQLKQAHNNFGEELENLASQDEELRKSLNQLEDALAQSSQNLGERQKQSGQQGQQRQSRQQGQQSQQSQQSQQRQQGQNNQNSQRSQGENAQARQGKSAQGENNGNGQCSGGNAENGKNLGSRRGKGHIENENIFSRDAVDMTDEKANIIGTQNNGGQSIEQDTKGMGEAGVSIPYGDVVSQYKNQELQSLEDYEIPHGMKELVKDYFSTLE